MTHASITALPLAGWYVISLRPSGGHAALRGAASGLGAGLIALSPWRIETLRDAGTRAALDAALSADIVIVTSPSAVRAAAAFRAFDARHGQRFIAVGEGTAAALRRAGIADVQAPARMDSDGVLALPALQTAVDGRDIGLLTAPGGRNRIEPVLRGRGARVLRAEVYRRVPIALSKHGVRAVLELDGPAVLALSSGEAFVQVLEALPPDALAVLRRCLVVAASERLSSYAREHGFKRVVRSKSARPQDLMEAVVKVIRDQPLALFPAG